MKRIKPIDDLQIVPVEATSSEDLVGLDPELARLQESESGNRAVQLVLRGKNGNTHAIRKASARQLAVEAVNLGPEAVMSVLVRLLGDGDQDAQERHRTARLVLRVLPKFATNPQFGPEWTPRLLAVVQPLLLDPDRIARQEGSEVIGALARAVGLRCLISVLRSDLESGDEGVRVAVAETVAAVAPTIGLAALLPFLEACCAAPETRLAGLMIVQRIGRQAGCGVLPYLDTLVQCVLPAFSLGEPSGNNSSGSSKNRAISSSGTVYGAFGANAIAALANASIPYGIEAFEPAAPYLWRGIRRARGRGLAAFLRALGSLVPLMDPDSAKEYAPAVLQIARREFGCAEDDVRRAALIAFQQCMPAMEATDLRKDWGPEFLQAVFVRRVALDASLSGLVVRTTSQLAQCSGSPALVVQHLIGPLRDSAVPLQKLGLDALIGVVADGAVMLVLPERAERLLVDGVVGCLRTSGLSLAAIPALNGIFKALGSRRSHKYSGDITSELQTLIASPDPDDRQAAAQACGLLHKTLELPHVGAWLYEQLGEEFPEVLASVLDAFTELVGDDLAGLSRGPPIQDLLPRLTPILRNRNERVQESCTRLVGQVAAAAGGAEAVSPREWLRICSELIELFKAPRLSVRRSANAAFGAIAAAIGPADVLVTLLANLRSPTRQSRVNTAVAIGIVADRCEPFTVLPVLMNEYRSPDKGVQQAVLKALSFMFEYIGPSASPYLGTVASLLDHSLTDAGQVHRQTAASIVQHAALGAASHGVEEILLDFLNELMPSIFETSPHVIDRVLDAIAAVRLALGAPLTMNYIWSGLFHPARKVRNVYWHMYNTAYVQAVDAIVPAYPVDVDGLDTWF